MPDDVNISLRSLSGTPFRLSRICLGCNVFGWTIDLTLSHRILDYFVDRGFNFLDTADVYSRWHPGNRGGESEIIIGQWLKKSGRKDQVILATKAGYLLYRGEQRPLSRSNLFKSVEASLRRLQVDTIDLLYLHIDDTQTSQEEYLQAVADLKTAGKIRAIAASNFSSERLKSAIAICQRMNLPPLSCVQPLYNILERQEFEASIEPLLQQHNIGAVTYHTLAQGFLTGKYRTEADLVKSLRGPRIRASYLGENGLRILAALDKVARQIGATPAQVAIAWCLNRSSILAPIVSATSIFQLEETLSSVETRLSPSMLADLSEASRWPLHDHSAAA